MNRLTALQVFRTIAESGSFAEAGRKLDLSPPAVSKNVAELEAYLGTRLINRTTRRVALTEEGRMYLEHITRGLDALSEGDAAISTARSLATGTLRVSAPMTVALTRISDAVPEFLSNYPELKLELHLEDRRVDIIREGYDLAVRGYSSVEDSSLIARRLGVMPHVLCAAPSYFAKHGKPQVPSDLKALDHIRFPYGGNADVWEFRKAGHVERITVTARYSVSSSLAVRDALRAGGGVSLIPHAYVAKDIENGLLETALHDWTTGQITHYAVYPSRHHLAPKTRAFLEFLIRQFGSPNANLDAATSHA